MHCTVAAEAVALCAPQGISSNGTDLVLPASASGNFAKLKGFMHISNDFKLNTSVVMG